MNAENSKPNSQPALEIIHQAWKDGRPIVPFFGAGISVGAGFPLTSELREYFCKVLFYIRNGGFEDILDSNRFLNQIEKATNNRWPTRDSTPAKYLANFGWPDFFRINADLTQIYDVLGNRCIVKKDRATGKQPTSTLPETWEELLVRYGSDHKPSLNQTDDNRLQAHLASLQNSVSEQERCEILKLCAKRRQLDEPFCKEWKDLSSLLPKNARKNKIFLKDQTVSASERARLCRVFDYVRGVRKFGWADDRNWLDAIVQTEILNIMNLEDSDRVRTLEPKVWRKELRLRVDWFRLLLELVEGRMGLADLLFSTLNRNREPSAGHIAIAHLACRMGWPMILTLNHDTLLKRAFQSERLPYKVFDINKDSSLPDVVVVASEWMSMIKLHGSAYGLRLGEPTNLELDIQTRETIRTYIPPRALIVVAGFSGYERRMMSLIESVCLQATNDRNDTKVLWLHQETLDRIPRPVEVLEQKSLELGKSVFVKDQIHDAGLFFLGVYQHLVHKLPRSRASYECFPKRLYKTSTDSTSSLQASDDPRVDLRSLASFIVRPDECDTVRIEISKFEIEIRKLAEQVKNEKVETEVGNRYPDLFFNAASTLSRRLAILSPSLHLSQRVQRDLSEYRVIWIDIEEHHTVSGVVSEIAERLRVHDPAVPPILLPVTESHDSKIRFQRSIRYLRRALRRGKYALVLDSLEGFGRSQLSHHGLSSIPKGGSPEDPKIIGVDRMQELQQFLDHFLLEPSNPENTAEKRARVNLGGSIVLASCDLATLRHPSSDASKIEGRYSDQLKEFLRVFAADLKVVSGLASNKNEQSVVANEDKSPRLVNNGFPHLVSMVFDCLDRRKEANSASDGTASGEFKSWMAFHTFLVATLFRRPRSVTSMHWVIKKIFSQIGYETQTGEIDQWLSELRKSELLQETEGGFLWIEHHTHEVVYRLLTQGLWEQELREIDVLPQLNLLGIITPIERTPLQLEDRKAYCLDWKQNFFLALCIASWNSTIGRYHYVHAFQRSGDTTALFEYLYHRFSSLRYLWIARQLVCSFSLDDPLNPQDAYWKCSQQILSFLVKSLNEKPIRNASSLLSLIDKARARYLRTLVNVIEREQQHVFKSATADTWLNWLETIDGNRGEISNCAETTDSQSKTDKADSKEIKTLIATLRILILDLQARLHREKGDYVNCLRARMAIIPLLGGQGEEDFHNAIRTITNSLKIEPKEKSLLASKGHTLNAKTKDSVLFHTWSDLLGCCRRSNKNPIDADLSVKLLEQFIKWGTDRPALALRFKTEQIRFEVDEWDFWSPYGVDAASHSSNRERLISSIDELEAQVYGASFSSERSFSSLVSTTFGLRGWLQVAGGNLQEGKANLGESLNGLREGDSDQQFQITVIRRRMASALMREASNRLNGVPLGNSPSIVDCDFAEARLREAKQELDVVERLLRRGRRNVRAWKRLYRAKVQLEIEQMLLLIQRIESQCLRFGDAEQFAGKVQERLLTGLVSIRGSLDCTVREKLEQHGDRFGDQVLREIVYTVDQWIKLFVVGRFAYFNFIALVPYEASRTERDPAQQSNDQIKELRALNSRFLDSYLERWKCLNDSADIFWGNNDRKQECCVEGETRVRPITDFILTTVDQICSSRLSKQPTIRCDTIAAMQELRLPTVLRVVNNSPEGSSMPIAELIAKIIFENNVTSHLQRVTPAAENT